MNGIPSKVGPGKIVPDEEVKTSSRNGAGFFEVEIHTGNRAEDSRLPATAVSKTSAPSALALQRQERTKRRHKAVLLVSLVALSLLLVWGTAVWWQPILQGNIVARVNGQPITMEQIDREVRLGKALSAAASKEEQAAAPPSMMEQLILAEIKAQAAHRAGFSVTAQEVDLEIAGIIERAGLNHEKVDRSLSQHKLTRDDLRASLSNIVLANRFIERYVVSGVTDPKTRLQKINQWEVDLVQLARVERLRNPTTSTAPRVGNEAPEFVLQDLDGKEIKLSSLRGKPVVINFWAPWCPPCRAEMPTLRAAYEASGPGEGSFELLAVATQSEPPNVKAFVQEYGITFPVLLDAQNDATNLYQVGPIPVSYFIDKGGTIRAVHIGQMSATNIKEYLARAR